MLRIPVRSAAYRGRTLKLCVTPDTPGHKKSVSRHQAHRSQRRSPCFTSGKIGCPAGHYIQHAVGVTLNPAVGRSLEDQDPGRGQRKTAQSAKMRHTRRAHLAGLANCSASSRTRCTQPLIRLSKLAIFLALPCWLESDRTAWLACRVRRANPC